MELNYLYMCLNITIWKIKLYTFAWIVFNYLQESASEGRDYTVSLALPGSILENAQSPELRTYLAGQIAR